MVLNFMKEFKTTLPTITTKRTTRPEKHPTTAISHRLKKQPDEQIPDNKSDLLPNN
jgi:hypothetical protein